MANTIRTLSKPKADPEHRSVETPAPKCLQAEDLGALVEALGEEMVFDYAMRQLIISFRSSIRSMLDARDDNGEQKYPDEFFASEDFLSQIVEWTPSVRVQKSPVDKVADALKSLDPEQAAQILAQVQATLAG